MPERDAKIGDAYWVYSRAVTNPSSVGKIARPMACVAEQPCDPTAWKALPRISLGYKMVT